LMTGKQGMIEADALLQQRMEAAGLSWAAVRDRCDQIVLFGSRAANVHAPDSDYDLLCIVRDQEVVSREDHRATPGIDLVWISQSRLHTPEWLGSELAQHIARYGRWLHGENDWSHLVFSSRQAVNKKAAQIRARIEALMPRWDRFLPSYRRKYSRLVRRDLQRLQMLARGDAVPPSPVLDQQWQQAPAPLVAWAEANLEPGLVDLKLLGRLEWKEREPADSSEKKAYALTA
jgi:predicted nucleotidyltransferase